MKRAQLVVISMLFVVVSGRATEASEIPDQPWAATYAASLSSAPNGSFADPRFLHTRSEFAGVAWEERQPGFSRVGVSLFRSGGFDRYVLPESLALRGFAATMVSPDQPAVFHGAPDQIRCSRLVAGEWRTEPLCTRGGELFDVAVTRTGRPAVLHSLDGDDGGSLVLTTGDGSRWESATIGLPAGLPPGPRRFGPARVAAGPDGRLAVVFLVTVADRSCLCRARCSAGGWVSEQVPSALFACAPGGRIGAAFDASGHLCVAFCTSPEMRLVFADTDATGGSPSDPDPGCVLRVPQVDLAFGTDGTGSCVYFARTPDGGLQIRIARYSSGQWTTRMVDRTMSKLPTATLSLLLDRGEIPFLSYAIGPARRVIMAYPKDSGPPGLEPGNSFLLGTTQQIRMPAPDRAKRRPSRATERDVK